MKKYLFISCLLTTTFFANAQNIGINNLTPEYPLSFDGGIGDKISLWSDGSPMHYGFGIQNSLLQIFSKSSNTDIAFGYGSSASFTERMRIKGNGNVGIGTLIPLQKLHVDGATILNGNVGIGVNASVFPLSFSQDLGDKISLWSNSSNSYGFGIQGGLLQIHTPGTTDNIAFGYGSSISFTERMLIKNQGEIGIELNGRIVMRNGTLPVDIGYGPGIWLTKADNSSTLGFMGTQNNQNIGFYGGPGAWGFTYDAVNSRVGIGNNNPAYQLDVLGNSPQIGSFVNTATTQHYLGISASCNNTAAYGIGISGSGGFTGVFGQATLPGDGYRYGVNAFGTNGTTQNIGVHGSASGTGLSIGVWGDATGANSWAAYFTGSAYTTGTFVTSDRKLKNDIKPLNGALSIINQLNPSFYTFKTTEYKQMHLPEGLHYGLIADEVQQVIPGIVKKAVEPTQFENHDGYSGRKLADKVEFNAVNYTEIIPILVAAIKEQQVMIEELRMRDQKIDQQQQQIDELKKLVEKLLK